MTAQRKYRNFFSFLQESITAKLQGHKAPSLLGA